jgi:hypothetical protein
MSRPRRVPDRGDVAAAVAVAAAVSSLRGDGADKEAIALPRQDPREMSAGEDPDTSCSVPAEAAGDPPSMQKPAPEAIPAGDGLEIPGHLQRCLGCNRPGTAGRPVTKDVRGRCFHDACRLRWESL